MNKVLLPSRPFYIVSVLIILMLTSTATLIAQARRSKVYEGYVSTYSAVAVAHMKKHQIPASITLAQGLLESGAGKSILATEGNNHFGIKCHNDWKGGTMHKNDDRANECFRKYKRAEDSFEDHSTFLKRSRYSKLFQLQLTDYKAWARGLQTAGYATDRAYANKLIKLIEDYELHKYDREYNGKDKVEAKIYSHTPYLTHGLVYIVTRRGDSYETIAKEFGFKTKDLYKHNEVPKDFPLSDGDIVYFEKKKTKADKPYYEHTVRVGESMHSISQRYGIRVKNLYKMNKKDLEYTPTEGDILKLR